MKLDSIWLVRYNQHGPAGISCETDNDGGKEQDTGKNGGILAAAERTGRGQKYERTRNFQQSFL